MEEGLKLKISADLGQTIAALREMQREVAKTGAGATKLGDGVTGASNKMPQLAKSTGQATAAITNFGRVASDAPFGLIGIANNIDPLIQSFVYLKKETGGAKGALSALGQSLLGGGGLILAVSLLTSAMQFAEVGLSRWGITAKKTKEDTNSLNNEMSEMVRSLSKQKEEFNAYLSIAKDVSKSDNDREAALAKLNKIIPDHIGVLTKQNIATAEGARITAVYVQALEARATAELYINRIAENNVKIFEKRNEQERIYAEFNAKILQRQAAAARFRAAGKEEIALTIDNEINNLIKERNDLLKTNSDEIKNSIRENNKLRESYTSLLPTLEILNGKDGVGGLSDKTKEQVRNLAAQNGVINSMRDNIETMNKLEQQRVENQKLLLQLQMQGSTLSGTGMKPVTELTPIQQLSIVGSDDAKSNIQKLVEESNKLNKSFELTDELINTVGNEFANLFTNISKDGTKAFEDFAKAVAETTTRILINYAVTQALKALLNSISGGAGTALDSTGLTREAVNQLNPGAVLRGSDINLSSLRALG